MCSVPRTEVVLRRGESFFYRTITGIVVDCITECAGRLIGIVREDTGRGAARQLPNCSASMYGRTGERVATR